MQINKNSYDSSILASMLKLLQFFGEHKTIFLPLKGRTFLALVFVAQMPFQIK